MIVAWTLSSTAESSSRKRNSTVAGPLTSQMPAQSTSNDRISYSRWSLQGVHLARGGKFGRNEFSGVVKPLRGVVSENDSPKSGTDVIVNGDLLVSRYIFHVDELYWFPTSDGYYLSYRARCALDPCHHTDRGRKCPGEKFALSN